MNFTQEQVIAVMRSKGYRVFSEEKPFQLDFIGIRNKSRQSDLFDDEFHVFYKDDSGILNHMSFAGTTDPGKYYLENPMNKQGTFILMPGQYIDCWKKGLHLGKYPALRQVGTLIGYRDDDKDTILDIPKDPPKEKLFIGTGFGVNFHPMGKYSKLIKNWSAGCQGPQEDKYVTKVLEWVDQYTEKTKKELISYTLLEEEDFTI